MIEEGDPQNLIQRISTHPLYTDVLNGMLKYNNSDIFLGVFSSKGDFEEHAMNMRNSEFWNLALREYHELPNIGDLEFTLGQDDKDIKGFIEKVLGQFDFKAYAQKHNIQIRYLQKLQMTEKPVVLNQFNSWTTLYEGEILEGTNVPLGRGKMVRYNDSKLDMIYEGQLYAGKKHGLGRKIQINEDHIQVTEGFFVQDSLI